MPRLSVRVQKSMIVLAIDTAGTGCFAAVYDSVTDTVLASAGADIGRGHAEQLMAFIDQALAESGKAACGYRPDRRHHRPRLLHRHPCRRCRRAWFCAGARMCRPSASPRLPPLPKLPAKRIRDTPCWPRWMPSATSFIARVSKQTACARSEALMLEIPRGAKTVCRFRRHRSAVPPPGI